ncbi:MAG: endonuclease/exonuclease/phosphatase family protein [Oleiphilaceae bacterium]|nr:endonuclease/exonuclease/phosphatase family protein [Oleiphilaceae bacterium]
MRKKADICSVFNWRVWLACWLLIGWPLLARADLVVMAINTEWLWSPADGKVDGESVRVREPSLQDYHRELAFYASLVVQHEVDLLALSEIEGGHVAEDLREHLPAGWQVIFRQGKDTATGQDVAMLTRLAVEADSVTDFGFPKGYLPGDRKGKMLTKVLGMRVEHPGMRQQRVAVVTAHLLSLRNDSKAKARKRLKQAVALSQAVEALQKQADAVIVLGDLNDLPASAVLDRLKTGNALIDAAEYCGAKGKRLSRVDYVLYRGLECLESVYLPASPYSDHPAVLARFR